MSSPQESQPSKTAQVPSASTIYQRSIGGFRNWWSQRAFSLATAETKVEAPAALRDAAIQFSSRVWDIAEAQALERLSAERAAVKERVNEANDRVAAATLARGRAENHAQQLEKRLGVQDKALQGLTKDLGQADAREKVRKSEAEALMKDRADLERRLQDSEAREADLQKQIASLREELEAHEEDAEKFEQQQEHQLEKAKQHYASLESRLAAILEEHKSARQGFEKSAKGRN